MTTISTIFQTTIDEAFLDDTCGMMSWFRKYEQGGGITPRATALTESVLEATQDDLYTVSQLEDLSHSSINDLVNDILSKLTVEDRKDTRAMELLYRRLGWLAAYALYIEPIIRKIYLTVPMDQEIFLDRTPLSVRLRPGRVLKHRETGEVEVREYVPTHIVSSKWRESWEWHIRPHVNLLATREKLMRKVQWARMGGIHLGLIATSPSGHLRHPYVYGYHNTKTGEWSHTYRMTSEVDWIERPIWEFPYSLVEWVQRCGRPVADLQFPLSPRIPLNGPMVDAWVDRRTWRERQIRPIRDHARGNRLLRVMHWPQNTQHCAPTFGLPCEFKELCWHEPFLSTALQQTQFVPNISKAPIVHSLSSPEAVLRRKTLTEEWQAAIDRRAAPGITVASDDTLPVIDLTPINATVPTLTPSPNP